MRFVFYPLLFAGMSVAMLGCQKRKQYPNTLPPANPDRLDSSVIKVPLEPTDAGRLTGNGSSQASGSEASNALSSDSVLALVQSWQEQPVVWNKSAGNMTIGETAYNEWWEIFSDYSKITKFQNFVYPLDANSGLSQGEVVATTVKDILIQNGYQGAITMPNTAGDMVSLRMGDSLTQKGIYSVSEGDLNQANPDASSRGKAFFKRFYNAFVKKDEGSENYDCFAENVCRYAVMPDFFALSYNSPRSESGYLYISRDNNVLQEAFFSKPDLLPAGYLADDKVLVDLLDGAFADEEGTILELGSKYGDFSAKTNLPKESTWYSLSRSFMGEFLGLNLYLSKDEGNQDNPDYIEPAGSDYVTGFSLIYSSGKLLQIANLEAPYSVPLEDEARTNWLKGSASESEVETHFSFLNSIKTSFEGVMSARGDEILESRLTGLRSPKLSDVYRYKLSYKPQNKDFGISLTLTTSGQSPYLSVRVEMLEDFNLDLLKLSKVDDTWMTGSIGVGTVLQLEDIDSYFKERATLSLGNRRLRLPFEENQILEVQSIDANGIVAADQLLVSKLYLGSHIYFLDEVECEAGRCFRVVGIEVDTFVNAKSSENPQGLTICGDVSVSLGMTRNDFETAVGNADGCALSTVEQQVGLSNKTIYFVPEDAVTLYFESDDNTTLSDIVFYEGGVQ